MFRSIHKLLGIGKKKLAQNPSKFFKNTRFYLEGLEERSTPTVTFNGGQTAAYLVPENTANIATIVATGSGTDQGATITYSLTASGGDPTKFSINPTTGVLSFNPNSASFNPPNTISGSINGVPDFENPQGNANPNPPPPLSNTYSVTVHATASTGGAADQLAVVLVQDANDPPVGGADTANGVNFPVGPFAEDTGPWFIPFGTLGVQGSGLLGNDSPGIGNNEGGQTLTLVSVANGVGGTAAITVAPFNPTTNPQNTVKFTPNLNFNGNATFTYTIQDNGTTNGFADPKSTTVTVTIPVSNVNDPPLAFSNSLSAVSAVATPGTLLATDFDTGDTLSYALVDQNGVPIANGSNIASAHGTVQITNAASGAFTYTSDVGYTGPGTFFFKVTDSQNASSNIAQVSITVTQNNNPVNQPPVVQTPPPFSTAEDTTLVGNLSSFASDPNNDPLTFSVLPTANTHGNVSINQNSGVFTYVPDANYNGPADFLFFVNDGTVNSNATLVTISVAAIPDAPTITTNTLNISEGATVTFGVNAGNTIAANDVDLPAPTLTFTVSNVSRGQFLLNGTPTLTFTQTNVNNGNVQFVHDGSEVAPAYTLTVSDGTLSSQASVAAVTFTNVNDAPVGQTATFSTPKNVNLSGQLVANDPDNANLNYSIVNGSLVIVSGTGSGAGSVNITNASNGSFLYTPSGTFVGQVKFQFQAADSLVSSAPVDVFINVLNVNTPPQIIPGQPPFTTNEDTVLSSSSALTLAGNQTRLSFLVSDVDNPLAGDGSTGPFGATWNYSIVSQPAAGQGTVTITNPNLGAFVFTPGPNFNGTATFTFQANDGFDSLANPGTATITVSSVLDAPIAQTGTFTTTQGSTPVAGQVPSATNIENNGLEYSVVTQPPAGQGTVAFVNSTQAFLYTRDPAFSGTTVFTYQVRDTVTNLTTTATVTVTVTAVAAVNTAPVIQPGNNPLETVTVNENTTFVTTITATDTDVSPIQNLTFSLIAGDQSALFNITPNPANPRQATLSFKVAPDFEAPAGSLISGQPSNLYFVRVLVTDNGSNPSSLSDDQLYSVAVSNVNDPPIAVNDTNVVAPVAEDSAAIFIPFATLLANDSTGPANSQDGAQTLTITNVTMPGATGTATITSAPDPLNNVKVVLAANFNGTATFTYTVADSGGGSTNTATATGSFTVTAVNDNPQLTAASLGARSILANSPNGTQVNTAGAPGTAFPVAATDPADGNPGGLVFSLSGPGSAAFAIGSSSGQITVANASLIGVPGSTFSPTVTVTDQNGTGLSASSIITITVANTNPVGTDDTIASSSEGAVYNIPWSVLTGNDFSGRTGANTPGINEPGQTLSITGNVNPAAPATGLNRSGTNPQIDVGAGNFVNDTPNQRIVFTPPANFNGNVRFQYNLSDGSATVNNAATVNFTVLPVNNAPTVNAGQIFTVAANAAVGTNLSRAGTGQVGVVVSDDVDANTNPGTPAAQRSYSLSGTTAFSIDPSSGQLRVNDQSQITAANSPFTFTVTVTDFGSPTLSSQTTNNVQVFVVANANPPTITTTAVAPATGSGNGSTLTIAAVAGNTAVASLVGQRDTAATVTEGVSFAFNGGANVGDFALANANTTNGTVNLNFNSSPTIGSHVVVVRATDTGTPNRTFDQTITVNVSLTNASTGTVVFPGGTTNIGNNNLSFTGATTFSVPSGSATVSGSATLTSTNFTIDVGAGASLTMPNEVNFGSNPLTVNVGAGGTVTLSGRLRGSGGIVKTGAGTLILSNTGTASDFTGNTVINGGRLSVSLNNQLGNTAGNVIVTTPGVFESTGTWTTGRTFFLNNGSTLQVANGTLTMNGAAVNGGFISGPGTLVTATTPTTVFTGTTFTNSAVVMANVNTSFVNVNNGGNMTLDGTNNTFTLTSFTNSPSGILTINATDTANATDFTTTGQLIVNGTLVNGTVATPGTSSMVFGGTTTVNSTGIINHGAATARLANGRMNNIGGAVGTAQNDPATPGQKYKFIVDFGGFYTATGGSSPNLLSVNGGQFSTGGSPGFSTTADFNINGGGNFLWEIANATGTAGQHEGWDMLIVNETMFNPTAKTYVTATSANPFNIDIVSRLNSGTYNVSGPAANFDPHQSYSWRFIDGTNAEVVGAFDPAAFKIDTAGFVNGFDGAFSVVSNDGGKTIDIVYTPETVATTTTLTATHQATTGGELVMLTATVNASGASGSVTFLDNGTPLPGGTNVSVSGGVAVFSTTLTAAGNHAFTAAYSGDATYQGSTSGEQTVAVAAPLQVVSASANGNVPGMSGDHSRVVNMTVAFSQPVQLDSDAIALSLHTNNVSFGGVAQPNGFGSLPTSLVLNTTDNMNWTVTFSGNTDNGADGFASLKDGVYDLNIDGAKVHPIGAPGVSMGGSSTATVYRLFGDTDAAASTPAGGVEGVDFQAVVNTGDNLNFRNAFNNPDNYVAALDFDGDGVINTGDNFEFRDRFNKTLTWKA
jgi:autotransporter-associated beta strand protein